MLAANQTTVDNDTTTTRHNRYGTTDNDSHSNDPGNGCQGVENVDSDIPAERKPAKVFCRVIVSRIIGILGLCVWGGGGVEEGGEYVCVCGEGRGWGRGGGVQR